MAEKNLKVNVGADTSQFDKGIKQVKSDLKSFGAVSDQVLGKVGQAFGVDTRQVEQMTSAIRGMGEQLKHSGEQGAQALGKMLSGVTAFGAGVAALGIAGIVAGFKALNAEAENFKTTLAGANIELQTKAYIETYRQALHDVNAETGKSVAETQSQWRKFWATLPTRLASATATTARGTATGAAVIGGATAQQLQLQQQINVAQQSSISKAERAEQIAGRIYEIDRARSDNMRVVADLERDIAEYKRIMRSETATLAERQDAYGKAVELTNQKYELQVPLMRERSQLVDEMNSLSATTVEQADQANQLYAQAVRLEEQQQDELRTIERLGKAISTQTAADNKELAKSLALLKQIEEVRALDLSVSGLQTAGATTQGAGLIPRNIDTTALQSEINTALGGSLYLSVGLKVEKGTVTDLSHQLSNVVNGLAESLSESIGGLIGDLVTGGDAWGNFANAAMSAFGNMATSVGKIAIECGVASLGIKAALTDLGPTGAAAAIAAGSALVILGAAVKSGLSNIASGNYSASAGVATSSYAGGSMDYETKDVNIKVSGTLQADGDALKAVISNVDKRNGYTT